jgi:hypothetical protein
MVKTFPLDNKQRLNSQPFADILLVRPPKTQDFCGKREADG